MRVTKKSVTSMAQKLMTKFTWEDLEDLCALIRKHKRLRAFLLEELAKGDREDPGE
jgi:hypothetical protein